MNDGWTKMGERLQQQQDQLGGGVTKLRQKLIGGERTLDFDGGD